MPLSLAISLLVHTVALAYFGWVATPAGVHCVLVQSGYASIDLQASMASVEGSELAETEPLSMAVKSNRQHDCEMALAEDVNLPPAPSDIAPRIDLVRVDVSQTTGDTSPNAIRRDMGRHRMAELTGSRKASSASRASKASHGAESTPTVAVHNPAPVYPLEALEARLTGRVEIWATVDVEGKVHDAGIYRSSGIPSLDAAALEAVRHWRFSRAKSQGNAIRKLVLPINFTIDDP